MKRASSLSVAFIFLAATTVAGGAAALTPTKEITASRPVQDLALARRSVAYVADARDRLECGRIGFWNPATRASFTLDAKEQCAEETSTGQGISDVSVAARRFLWLTYAGGNFREWTLWTATTTRRTPRQLRFVARDVDAPPPIVVGPGTSEGIPYAVDREVTYLGDDGKAIFRTTVAAPVRLISAGPGPNGVRVAALLASGLVIGLDRGGHTVTTSEMFPKGPVVALRVSPYGIALQIRNEIHFDDIVVELPRGATMVDVAQGRVLWTRMSDLGATTVGTGTSVRLVDGSPRKPAYGQIEREGIAWSVGRAVRWRGGALP